MHTVLLSGFSIGEICMQNLHRSKSVDDESEQSHDFQAPPSMMQMRTRLISGLEVQEERRMKDLQR